MTIMISASKMAKEVINFRMRTCLFIEELCLEFLVVPRSDHKMVLDEKNL